MSFDQKLLLSCLVVLGGLLIYAAFNALVCFGGILKKCDDDENKRKNGENDGKPKNTPREPTKYDCLTYEPRRLARQIFSLLSRLLSKLFLFFRNLTKFSDLFRKPVRLSGKFFCGLFRIFRKKNEQSGHLNGQKTVGSTGIVDVDMLHARRHGFFHFLHDFVRFRIHK